MTPWTRDDILGIEAYGEHTDPLSIWEKLIEVQNKRIHLLETQQQQSSRISRIRAWYRNRRQINQCQLCKSSQIAIEWRCPNCGHPICQECAQEMTTAGKELECFNALCTPMTEFIPSLWTRYKESIWSYWGSIKEYFSRLRNISLRGKHLKEEPPVLEEVVLSNEESSARTFSIDDESYWVHTSNANTTELSPECIYIPSPDLNAIIKALDVHISPPVQSDDLVSLTIYDLQGIALLDTTLAPGSDNTHLEVDFHTLSSGSGEAVILQLDSSMNYSYTANVQIISMISEESLGAERSTRVHTELRTVRTTPGEFSPHID